MTQNEQHFLFDLISKDVYPVLLRFSSLSFRLITELPIVIFVRLSCRKLNFVAPPSARFYTPKLPCMSGQLHSPSKKSVPTILRSDWAQSMLSNSNLLGRVCCKSYQVWHLKWHEIRSINWPKGGPNSPEHKGTASIIRSSKQTHLSFVWNVVINWFGTLSRNESLTSVLKIKWVRY